MILHLFLVLFPPFPYSMRLLHSLFALVRPKALCFSQASACWTASAALHFLLVLVVIPAPDALVSLNPVYCRCARASAMMNSSLTELNGSLSLLLFPYSPLPLRLRGKAQPTAKIAAQLTLKDFHYSYGTSWMSRDQRILGRIMCL